MIRRTLLKIPGNSKDGRFASANTPSPHRGRNRTRAVLPVDSPSPSIASSTLSCTLSTVSSQNEERSLTANGGFYVEKPSKLSLGPLRNFILSKIPSQKSGYLTESGTSCELVLHFFELRGKCLVQFTKDDVRNPIFAVNKVYDIRNSMIGIERSNRCGFHISFGDHTEPVVLVAASETDRNSWVSALQRAAVCAGLKQFQALYMLGQGEYGKVYLARSVQGNRSSEPSSMVSSFSQFYAVKEITLKRGLKPVVRERIVLQTLKGHPFINEMHACFKTDTSVFFVLEFVSGGDLFSWMNNNDPSQEQMIVFAAEIALALEFMHQRKVVYRDLKPENVLVSPQCHLKIADMGLAKKLSHNKTTKTFCGTASYLAPEVIERMPYSFSVDFWQYACFVYELYAGRSPFWRPKDQRQNLQTDIVHCKYRMSSRVPASAHGMIIGLLVRYPEQRLGCGEGQTMGDNGWYAIKSNRYFAQIEDWDSYLDRGRNPQSCDALSNQHALHEMIMTNFDPACTSEPPDMGRDDRDSNHGMQEKSPVTSLSTIYRVADGQVPDDTLFGIDF